MTAAVLSVAILLMGGYAIFIVALFAAALIRGWRWKRQNKMAARLTPEIRASLAEYLAGNDDLDGLQRYLALSRNDVARTILSFQDAVAGSARDRLCDLTLKLELLDQWRREIRSRDVKRRRAAFAGIAFACSYDPCRRAVGDLLTNALDDPDREVRVGVAQALARFGSPAEVDMVFRMATRANQLTRVLVAGPIRPHAMDLAKRAIPETFQAGSKEQILATLEIVVAWERALPLVGLDKMIHHEDKAIRVQALRAAPLVIASPENQEAVMQALVHADPEIATAAAAAAGRLRLKPALPLLTKCCRSGNAALARTSAAALLALAPEGVAALNELASSEDASAASAAAEALERVYKMRKS